MKLQTFLSDRKITYAEFALRIGVSNAKVVHRYCTGDRRPRPEIMTRIATATDGAVTANDFFDTPPPDPDLDQRPPVAGVDTGAPEIKAA